jgi:hypothetical protein
MFGIIVLIIGVLFLLKNLGLISGSLWSIIWPLLLIIVGLKTMFRKKHEHFGWGGHCCGFKDEMHKKFHEGEQQQK